MHSVSETVESRVQRLGAEAESGIQGIRGLTHNIEKQTTPFHPGMLWKIPGVKCPHIT